MNGWGVAGLVLLGLLLIPGRFLPPTAAWGFHHLAYLPDWFFLAMMVAGAVILVPSVHRSVDSALFGRGSRWLFGRGILPSVIVSALATGLFILLRTPTHFLGDGVLVGELAGLGSRFRGPDAMDYLLHRWILQEMGKTGSTAPSFRLYAWGSCLAGFAAVLIALTILRRSKLPAPVKMMSFLLWILATPVLLYCGYVESYGYLSVAMLGFLWSGALAQRGELRPWVPGLFYGLALFFHTTALFATPALLWLALRPGPARVRRGNWIPAVLVPAALLPLAAVLIHIAAGFDAEWFRREFLEGKNQKQMLIHLSGPHGLFSLNNVKDLANWLVLVVPVTGYLFFARIGALRQRWREPDISFLLVQTACFLVPFLFLDRKLGAARDWDLLTPQVAGLAFLASRLWEKEVGTVRDARGLLPPVRVAGIWTAALLVVPWLLVNASTDASMRRFDEIRTDFPRFAKGYAAEELAKYYRDHTQYEKALAYYEESVGIYPNNPRTRILLGSSYYMLDRLDEAEKQYDRALELDPKSSLALNMKAKLAVRKNDFGSALAFYRRLVQFRGDDPEILSGYGFSALRQQEYSEAREALMRSVRIRYDANVLHFAGVASAYLGRWDEALDFLNRSAGGGNSDPMTDSLKGAILEARHAERIARGEPTDRRDLEQARELAARAASAAPREARFAEQLRHLDQVLAGNEPPIGRFEH